MEPTAVLSGHDLETQKYFIFVEITEKDGTMPEAVLLCY